VSSLTPGQKNYSLPTTLSSTIVSCLKFFDNQIFSQLSQIKSTSGARKVPDYCTPAARGLARNPTPNETPSCKTPRLLHPTQGPPGIRDKSRYQNCLKPQGQPHNTQAFALLRSKPQCKTPTSFPHRPKEITHLKLPTASLKKIPPLTTCQDRAKIKVHHPNPFAAKSRYQGKIHGLPETENRSLFRP